MTKQFNPATGFDRQAESLSQDDLAGFPDQAFKLIEGMGHNASDLRERWDNRLVLESSSLAELYLNDSLEILLYGNWPFGPRNLDWFCRVTANPTVGHINAADLSVDTINFGNSDRGQDEIVLVVVVECMERPKVFVPSIGRTYLVEKQVYRSGESGLYNIQVFNGRASGGYKLAPRFPHGEVPLCRPIHAAAYPGRKVVKRAPQVVDRVTDRERKQLRDWLGWTIAEHGLHWLRVGDKKVSLHFDAMPISAKRGSAGNDLINVAIGPLNL